MRSTDMLNRYFDFVNKHYNTIKTAKKNCIVNNNFIIFYQNVRVLRTKLTNVRSSLPHFITYDIIILTETWLSSDIADFQLGFDGFLIFF